MGERVRRMMKLSGYAVRQKWRLAVILVLTCLMGALAAAQPWPLKILIDYALSGEDVPGMLRSLSPTSLVVLAAVAALTVQLVQALLDGALTWSWAAAGQRMVYDLSADLFDRLQRLSLRFHARRSAGDALSRLSGDTYCVYSVTDALLVSPAQQLLTIGSVTAVAWALSPSLTVVVLAITPILAGVAIFFGPRLKQKETASREAQAQLMSVVHRSFSAIAVVQAFSAEDRQRDQYRRQADAYVLAARRGAFTKDAMGLLTGLCTTASLAVVIVVGGRQVLQDAMTVGTLLVFMQYARSLQGAFQGLMQSYGKLRSAEASVDRVMEILQSDDRVVEKPDAQPAPMLDRPGARIAFENITFGYESGQPVLRDIDLVVEPGQTVALIGSTGAGKTTLASMVPRFFDPWEGRVTFNGEDLRNLKLEDLRRQVAIVLQQPFLMPISIAENIAYGRPDATPEQIAAAATSANAHDFIQRLPEGYATVLGERGASLSGGERQRLAIARAMISDAPVVILDEPTSALDAETELTVVDALQRLTAGRTTFIIAHRLSTARHADRIVVLGDGRILEEGPHDELMRHEGVYHRFWRLQTSDTAAGGAA